MKVTFRVNRVECLRKGIDTNSELVTLDLSPYGLMQDQRELLARHVYKDGDTLKINQMSESGGLFSNLYVEADGTGLVDLLEAIVKNESDVAAKIAAEKENERKGKEKRIAECQEVLDKRTTKEEFVKVYATRGKGGIDYQNWGDGAVCWKRLSPAWPYRTDAIVTESLTAQEWVKGLEIENANRKAKAEREAVNDLEKREAAEKAKAEKKVIEAAKMGEWILAHGSERLKRCFVEGIECAAAYRDERLSVERPGWSWITDEDGDYHPPRNPPLEAFAILDEARLIDPTAELNWLTKDHEHGDCNYDYVGDCPKYDLKEYVAIARFMGREIVFRK